MTHAWHERTNKFAVVNVVVGEECLKRPGGKFGPSGARPSVAPAYAARLAECQLEGSALGLVVGDCDRQRHLLFADHAAVYCGPCFRRVVLIARPHAFARESSPGAETPFRVDRDRAFDEAVRATELNLRAAFRHFQTGVLAAPVSVSHSVLLLRHRSFFPAFARTVLPESQQG